MDKTFPQPTSPRILCSSAPEFSEIIEHCILSIDVDRLCIVIYIIHLAGWGAWRPIVNLKVCRTAADDEELPGLHVCFSVIQSASRASPEGLVLRL